MRFLFSNFLALGLCAIATVLHAAEPKPASVVVDPDLPQPVDANVSQALLESSPFSRALNLSDSLVLTGIAYIDGKPVATIVNKATRESYVVSEEPNVQGWKLAETSASTQLKRTQAKIMVGTEVVTVRYSEEATTPEMMKKGGKPGRSEGGGESGGERPKRDYPKPSKEDRERFMSLSDGAREKFRQVMTESREKMMTASPEERMTFAKKMFEKIEAEDKGGKAK